jgi:hypothetical protein
MAERDLWLARRNSVERTYGHTLYLVLITSPFYWALDRRLDDPAVGWPDLKLPFIQTGLSSAAVWATGPFVVSFLTLAVLGTLEALDRVDRAMGIRCATAGAAASVVDGELLDAEPTALEMAFYCTPDAHRLWRACTVLSQPIALTLPWVFAGWLLLSPLWGEFADFDQYWELRLAGTVMVMACIPRLARLWIATGHKVYRAMSRSV